MRNERSCRASRDLLSARPADRSGHASGICDGLADSPVGLAAWLHALFQDVSDSGGDPESVYAMDAMLDDIMPYWLPNTGASSARLYGEGMQEMMKGGMPTSPMLTPSGISMFPGEQIRLSRRW